MRALLVIAVVACGGATTTRSETPAGAERPLTAADLRPSSDGSPPLVAPSRLEPFRTAGDTVVIPDHLENARPLRGTFGFCVDERGQVGNIKQLESSSDVDYDAKMLATLQRWAYRPVMLDGKPTAVCSRITFIYRRG